MKNNSMISMSDLPIPKEIIKENYKINNEYRKYFIKKTYDYLLVDFTILSIVLTFNFSLLTKISQIASMLLFFCAICTKVYIVSRKLKEFVVPGEKLWKEYDDLVKKSKKKPKDERHKFIEDNFNKVYLASLREASKVTHQYYSNWMPKLNRFISFSFFCILIIMCNIGLSPYLQSIYVDIIVIILTLLSMEFGFRIIKFTKLSKKLISIYLDIIAIILRLLSMIFGFRIIKFIKLSKKLKNICKKDINSQKSSE